MGLKFSVSYDWFAKIISAAICVGLLWVAAVLHSVSVGIAVLLGLIAAYGYSPRRYTIVHRTITVKRGIGKVRVPLENLREARCVTADDLQGRVRLGASGGLFGYYGLFRTTKLGRCTSYVTDRKNMVVLIGVSDTTVFSPDDVEGFLSAIRTEV
jgi:hypothetical protein